MLQPTFIETAPAKINLYLHVTGLRADGFHELSSLVVFADVADRISALATNDDTISLSIEGPFAPDLAPDDENLVLRAARLLADRAGLSPGAQLTLQKNLPVASGIGGGSADAAATLRALVGVWGLGSDVSEDALVTLAGLWNGTENLHQALAHELGADVPVCLSHHPQMLGGIGEKLTLAPTLPPLWVVLANPGGAVSTASVFKAFLASGTGLSTAQPITGPLDSAAQVVAELASRRNDLEAPATGLEPAISGMLARMSALDGQLLARMSGSGATGFALFEDEPAATKAASALATLEPGWWVAAAPVLR